MFSMPRSMKESTSSIRMSPSSVRLARPMRSRSTAISDAVIRPDGRNQRAGSYVSAIVRLVLLVCVGLIAGCSGPQIGFGTPATPHPSAQPASHLASGGIVEYALPDAPAVPADCLTPCLPSPGSATLGPDGNVWFVDVSRGVVGKITPAGAITQLPMPAVPSGGAQTIAAGPDGNIWVLAGGVGGSQPDWILRVSTAGVVA